jgi:23S rRNA (guanosine2251-2'-O)-methyltransferase
MSASFYQIRQCNNPSCGLRFPLVEGQMGRCPRCLDETIKIAEYPLAREPAKVVDAASHPGPLVLLDNIRSAWNVGAIFRTADGFGFSGLHLCGITPTPENEAVRKTSLGAENNLPWRYHPNALLAARELAQTGYTLFALELTDDAIPLPQAGKIPEKPPLSSAAKSAASTRKSYPCASTNATSPCADKNARSTSPSLLRWRPMN